MKNFFIFVIAILVAALLINVQFIGFAWDVIKRHWELFVVIEGLLEIAVLAFLVVKAIAIGKISGNADEFLKEKIYSVFPLFLSPIALFESRVWYYGLLMRNGGRLSFKGEQHFKYEKNDGNASNQIALIMIILFEVPLTHFMVHLVSPKPIWAWLADILEAWFILYFVAEYRASHWRPISIDSKSIIIRYGIFKMDKVVPFDVISSALRCKDDVLRGKGILCYRQFGSLNVEIQLRTGSYLPNAWGRKRAVSKIYLSVDEPGRFIDAILKQIELEDRSENYLGMR